MLFLATQRKAHFLKALGTGGRSFFSVPLFSRAAFGLDLTEFDQVKQTQSLWGGMEREMDVRLVYSYAREQNVKTYLRK